MTAITRLLIRTLVAVLAAALLGTLRCRRDGASAGTRGAGTGNVRGGQPSPRSCSCTAPSPTPAAGTPSPTG